MSAGQLYATDLGMLYAASSAVASANWLGLFKNNVALVRGFNPLLLIEADFSGYSRIHLTGSWSGSPYINGDGNGESVNTLRTFTKSGGVDNPAIYGFFYISDGGVIQCGQTFADGPYPMVLDGDLIRITPKWNAGTPVYPEPD